MEEVVRRLERAVVQLEVAIERVADHELRLRTIEKAKWKAAGGVLVVSAVIPLLLHFMR